MHVRAAIQTLCILPIKASTWFRTWTISLQQHVKVPENIHEALDRNTDDYIVAFYADFSKAFDRVPHQHLLNKFCSIEVGGCLLDLLYDYLDNRN